MTKLMLTQLVQIEKALPSPFRLRILAMLQDGPLCVFQVTAALHLSPAAVSTHLGELRRAGVVEDQRRGRFVRYDMSPDAEVRQIVSEALCHLECSGEVREDQIQTSRERGRGDPVVRPRSRHRGADDATKGGTP